MIGPATGEEMATLLAAVIQEFELHESDWGALTTWNVLVDGVERGAEIAEETVRRLTAQRPFVIEGRNLQEPVAQIKPTYPARVNDIIAALNRHRPWVEASFRVRIGDAGVGTVAPDVVSSVGG